MRAFVTGASGFIGLNLVKKLLSEKWSVVCLTRKGFSLNLNDDKLSIIKGDLLEVSSFKQELKGIDIVFHLAGGLPHHKLSDQGYWDINVKGLKNLLGATKNLKVKRFVHVSTVGIYGPTNEEGVNENSPLNLTDAYSKTKAEAERVLREFSSKYKLPFTIIRPTIGYGPGDLRPGFSTLFRLVKKGRFIKVGKGNNYFHTIYIENLVDALMLAAAKKKAVGEDFIVGDDPCPKTKEIFEAIEDVEHVNIPDYYLPVWIAHIVAKFFDILSKINFPAPLTTQRVNFITQNRRYDISKARTVLGYNPKIKLQEGIRRTYNWYKENGYLV